MPALDGNMDTVSVTALSLWLAPGDKKVMPWTHTDRMSWLKNGIIKGWFVANIVKSFWSY